MKHLVSLVIAAGLLLTAGARQVRAQMSSLFYNNFGYIHIPVIAAESYLTWDQRPNANDKIYNLIGITDLNPAGAQNVYFIEIGEAGENIGGNDPYLHPYSAWQDGGIGTYHKYVDIANTLDGWYIYHVIQTGTREWRAQWGYNDGFGGITWQQEGDTLFSSSHDWYQYVAAGYETVTGNYLTKDIHHAKAKYEYVNTVWFGFCPSALTDPLDPFVKLGPCTSYDGGYTYWWDLQVVHIVFAPSVRRM